MSRILIIDDDYSEIQQVCVYLQKYGYNYAFILKSDFLFPRLETEHFDLLLMDVNMPGESGVTLLSEMSKHPQYSSIPVIMLTSDSAEDTLAKSFVLGAKDFINKPINEIILISRIKAALSNLTFIREIEKQRLLLSKMNDELEKRVTERTEALQQSEAKTKALIDAIPDAVFRISTVGEFLDYKANRHDSIYLPLQVTLGKNILDQFPQDFAKACLDQAQVSLSTKKIAIVEHYIPREDEGIYFEARLMVSGKEEIVGIVRDITARKQSEAKLIEAHERSLEMNRLKSLFLANISHELRTPMNAIMGFAEILVEEGTSKDAVMYASRIYNNGERLLKTINDILDLTKLETHKLELFTSPTSITELADNVIEIFKPQAEKKGLTLKTKYTQEDIKALIDPKALRKILNNLLSNAIKFTFQGSIELEINVLYEGDQTSLSIKITDTGIGISAEFIPQLFEEFKQESQGTSRQFEGVGLGLAITKRMVDLMKGMIWVQSTPNVGTTFTVHIPYQKA